MQHRIDPEWPIVTLAGTLCDERVFAPILADPILAAAKPQRRIINTDLGPYSSAAQSVHDLLLQLPERFIPLGFSLGAIVALEMAVLAPHRLGAMALLAANARAVPLADHAARRAMAQTDPVSLVSDTLWPRYVAPHRHDDLALRAQIAAMAAAAAPQTLPRQTELALTRSDKLALLPAMAMPALVLGGQHDAIAPPALQAEIAAALPCASLAIDPASGHFLPLENPHFCASALGKWLAAAQPLP